MNFQIRRLFKLDVNIINIADTIVIAIIVAACFRGIFKGLVISLFDLTSFFISAFGAAKLYPTISGFIQRTVVFKYVTEVLNNAMLNRSSGSEMVNAGMQESSRNTAIESANAMLEKIALPESIKNKLADIVQLDMSNLIDTQGIVGFLTKNIAVVIINILSIILIFFAIKLLLIIIANTFNQFMKLPVLNAFNSLGGGIFGAIGGIITVYIVFAIITLLAPLPILAPVNKLIENSNIGKILYNNNIIINLILGKKII